MASISKSSAYYLMNQYAFSRVMDAADERFFPITDETMTSVRDSMLSELAGGSEAGWCNNDIQVNGARHMFVKAFMSGMRKAYQGNQEVLSALDDKDFSRELNGVVKDSCRQFSVTLRRDNYLLLSNMGMHKGYLASSGGFRGQDFRELCAVDLDDVGSFYPNGFVKNVGYAKAVPAGTNGVKSAKDVKGQPPEFMKAISRCPLYFVDVETKQVQSESVLATGNARSKWNKMTKPAPTGKQMSLQEYFSQGAKAERRAGNMQLDVDDEIFDLDERQRRIYEQARLAVEEERALHAEKRGPNARRVFQKEARDAETAYKRWLEDDRHIPVPNTSTGSMLVTYDLRLTDQAGQCWSTQHAFGRMVDQAEKSVATGYRLADSYVVKVRDYVRGSLKAQGLSFDAMNLNKEDEENQCDIFVDAVTAGFASIGMRGARKPEFKERLRRGMDMGFAEFSKEYFDPSQGRQMILLNSRGLPPKFKANVPAFNNGSDIMAMYVDEIADRFPDARLIYSPANGRAPEGEATFMQMLRDTPVYDIKRVSGRRYITQQPVHAGIDMLSQAEPDSYEKKVEAAQKRPLGWSRDVSDMQVASGESAPENQTVWYG